ncbi:MAG TPA: GNAT family N-acetyltransferase [Clostridia bacterium]|nr:MAG: hypothetical protein BWX97_00193 [Firmicutes bacterium ADurb.Bin146]HOD92337.1 GNAT family N-acetyltransferase [Clostridia bacterium]HQM38666.1 GNAT family N-acetyltransferase [Clostridia bacterium]
MEFRSLKENELKEWTAFCGSVFPVGESYFMRHYVNDPYRDINGIFISKDDTGITSSVRVFTRYLRIKDSIIKVGGIGEVCTKPSHRGMGLSAKLLGMAIDYMYKNDMPLSILHTGTNHHYVKQGWFSICSYYKVYRLKKTELKSGYSIVKSSPADIDLLKKLYEEFAHKLSPVYIRNDEYYDKWVRNELSNTYLLIKQNQAVSYADCVLRERQGVVVKEYIGGNEMDMMKPFLYSICQNENWPKICAVSAPFANDINFMKFYDYGQMFRINKPFEISGKTIRYEEDLLPYLSDFPELSIDGY